MSQSRKGYGGGHYSHCITGKRKQVCIKAIMLGLSSWPPTPTCNLVQDEMIVDHERRDRTCLSRDDDKDFPKQSD